MDNMSGFDRVNLSMCLSCSWRSRWIYAIEASPNRPKIGGYKENSRASMIGQLYMV